MKAGILTIGDEIVAGFSVDTNSLWLAQELLKKGVVVAPSADGPKLCGPLLEMFRLTFDYLGVEFTGKILAEAFEKGEISQNQEALQEAYEFGVSL